jgi:hypothetical protein
VCYTYSFSLFDKGKSERIVEGRNGTMKNSVKVCVAGAILFVGGICAGVIGTVFGMIISFNRIGNSPNTPQPREIAEGLSYSVISTSIGMGVSFLGLCLGLGGLIAYLVGRKR